VPPDGHLLARAGEQTFVVTRVPLPTYVDLLGTGRAPRPDASIFVFADRSELLDGFRRDRLRALCVLLAAYLIALGATWIILRRIGATEAALEWVRRFRRALFSLSPDAILVADRDGTIVEVNPRFCAVTGYTPEEVIGQNARILQSGNTPVETYRDMWETLLAGKEWRGDLQNRRKDGSLYWEAHAIVPIRDATGEISRFVSFQRDISERHDMERA